MFRSITYVRINNGAAPSFWFDHWLPAGPLFLTHASLFSHSTRHNISVQSIFQSGFDLHLRPRLTTAASQQLDDLLVSLQDVTLSDGHDMRLLKSTDKPYTPRDAYTALDTSGEATDVHGRWIWGTKLPNMVKIFTWLYFRDRLSTRTNLLAKHIVDGAGCERCTRGDEDRDHVFFHCGESAKIWTALKVQHIMNLGDEDIWTAIVLHGLDASLWPFVLLAILWRIWDSRNGHIFHDEKFSHRIVLSRVRDDLVIWRKRPRPESVNGLLGWYAYICGCIPNPSPHSANS